MLLPHIHNHCIYANIIEKEKEHLLGVCNIIDSSDVSGYFTWSCHSCLECECSWYHFPRPEGAALGSLCCGVKEEQMTVLTTGRVDTLGKLGPSVYIIRHKYLSTKICQYFMRTVAISHIEAAVWFESSLLLYILQRVKRENRDEMRWLRMNENSSLIPGQWIFKMGGEFLIVGGVFLDFQISSKTLFIGLSRFFSSHLSRTRKT